MIIKCKLKDIVSYSKGQQINGSELLPEGDYDYLNGGINPSGKWNKYNTNENTITISEGGNSCGYVNYMTQKFWCGAHCYYLYNVKCNVKYLFYNLKFNENKLQGIRSGACMPNIKKNDLGMFELFIDDNIDNQKIVVSILDLISFVIQKREKQIAKLDELVKSQFAEMFGKVDCEEYKLEELINNGYITYHLDGNHGGLYPRTEEFTESGIPYIGANCINSGRIDFENAKYLRLERAKQFRKGIAKNNDVLFAHNATVGPVAILKTNYEFVILSTSLTAYRCNFEYINNYYLAEYLKSDDFVCQYINEMKQTTRSQIPITTQRKYRIKVPPIELQNKFAEFVKQIDKQKFEIQQSLNKTYELYSSLMYSFFEQ